MYCDIGHSGTIWEGHISLIVLAFVQFSYNVIGLAIENVEATKSHTPS